MSPNYQTDLTLKKVVSIIYVFVCFVFFVCMWSMEAIFQNLSLENGVKVTKI